MVVLGFLPAPVVRVTVVFPVFVRVVILGPDFVDRMVMRPMEITPFRLKNLPQSPSVSTRDR